jgi:NAD(P)-dependent dehydrogenase (short-subunit alcohol dehydrogenase family)
LGIAKALATDGWRLIINGMRPPEGAAAALEALEVLGADPVYVQGDLGTSEGRKAMLRVCEEHGPIQLLVNNAGVAPKVRADLLETGEESFDAVLGTNLRGTFFLTQAVARQMLRAKASDVGFSGKIVNITSISATVASINRGEYCIAKAGLAMMTQLFAVRLAAESIGVYEVRPGVIRTDMTAGVAEKYNKLIEDGLCLQPRWGDPSDVGRAVAALARGDFPYSPGQVIVVDGGLAIQRL